MALFARPKNNPRKATYSGGSTTIPILRNNKIKNKIYVKRKPTKCKDEHNGNANLENFLPRFDFV